jgi:hypothetical protein
VKEGSVSGITGSSFQKKRGGLGATPAVAAAPTRPFFQDNLLKNQCPEISRKIFLAKSPGKD